MYRPLVMRSGASLVSVPPGSNDDNPLDVTEDRITIQDWSRTGRGSHVDFEKQEKVPLDQGHFLGRGTNGDVYEVKIEGLSLAHKRVLFRRKVGDTERKEIEILKKLSHAHVVQVVGTYTHNKFLGIIMYPVAVCDLSTFFEDVEAWTDLIIQHPRSVALESLDLSSKERLDALGYEFPTDPSESLMALPIYVQIGCLLSTVAYLHGQQIRHKDLKPSNILLSKGKLWLSDFGSATDFSLLSQSATDNERGTPRYFSPEMARREACGRAADIFSLGCVLLEIMTLQRCGSLKYIRLNRTDDPCFHANLDKIDDWLQSTTPTTLSARESFVNCEIKRMLAQKASERPVISELLPSFSAADMAPSKTQGLASMFGGCCGSTLKSREQHQEQITQLRSTLETMTTQSYESASRIDKLGEEKRQAQMRAAKFAEVHSNLQRDYSELYFTSQNLMEQNKELMNAKDGEVNRLADLQEQHSTLEQDYNKLYKKYRNFRLEYERLRDRIDGNVKRSTDSAEHLQDMSIDDTQERWSLEGASGQDDTDIFARPQKPQAKIQKLWRTILQK